MIIILKSVLACCCNQQILYLLQQSIAFFAANHDSTGLNQVFTDIMEPCLIPNIGFSPTGEMALDIVDNFFKQYSFVIDKFFTRKTAESLITGYEKLIRAQSGGSKAASVMSKFNQFFKDTIKAFRTKHGQTIETMEKAFEALSAEFEKNKMGSTDSNDRGFPLANRSLLSLERQQELANIPPLFKGLLNLGNRKTTLFHSSIVLIFCSSISECYSPSNLHDKGFQELFGDRLDSHDGKEVR